MEEKNDRPPKKKWSPNRTSYRCADQIVVSIRRNYDATDAWATDQMCQSFPVCVPPHCVAYDGPHGCALASIDAVFSRDMHEMLELGQRRKVVTFPGSVARVTRRVLDRFMYVESLDMGRASSELGKQLQMLIGRTGDRCMLDYPRRLSLPPGLVEIVDMFFGAAKIRSVVIPSSVEVIGRNAFSDPKF